MKALSVALKAHYASSQATLSSCWLTVRTDGTVHGFTDHDQDIPFDLEAALGARNLYVPSAVISTGSVTYASESGYTPTDIATKSDLSVDNLEVHGLLVSPSITEADLAAGLWDYAFVVHFEVNWSDLTMGCNVKRSGTLGEVTVERGAFKAELRGLMQAYTCGIGEITSPTCRAILGDARCKKDLTTFTHTGTITGVNSDGVTIYDTGRTETGPTGGVSITGITNANPGVVTVSDASSLVNGEPVALSGIVGPALLNQVTIVRNVNTTAKTFELGIDTTNTAVYAAYVSGGTVTPLGAEVGAFDYGKITFTSGLNTGLKMEIKSYVVGQFTLWLPMPYAVSIGDTYIAVEGCSKDLLLACKAKFDNVANFRGEPWLPGTDRIVQIGKGQTA